MPLAQLVAQLTANQIPYEWIDWVHLAIYFFALPIVAFLGASLGLLGRARRGGVLWSTNVGLLGSAIACVVLSVGLYTLQSGSKFSHLAYFLLDYRWQMLLSALAASSGCSFVAAIAWRILYKPRQRQPFTFSMTSLLLVQLFVLMSLGSFVGLRLFLLTNSEDSRLHAIAWESPGWTLSPQGHEIRFDSTNLTPEQLSHELSKERIAEIANYREITSLVLKYHPDWDVDFSPLLNSKSVSGVTAILHQPSASFLHQLAAAKMKYQRVVHVTTATDLSPLASSKTIEDLRLGGHLSVEAIESLSESLHLKGLSFEVLSIATRSRPINSWPQRIEWLGAFGSPLHPRDCDSLAGHPCLKQLDLPEFALDSTSTSAICGIPNLQSLAIGIDQLSGADFEVLAKRNLNKVEISILSTDPTLSDLMHLQRIANLQSLVLANSYIQNESLLPISQIASLEYLTIASPDVTEQGLLDLASLPKLRQLKLPWGMPMAQLQQAFDKQRNALKLPRVILMKVGPLPSRTNAAESPKRVEGS